MAPSLSYRQGLTSADSAPTVEWRTHPSNTSDVAAKVFSTIGDINVRMISQGASEINLTFVVEEDDVPEVVRRLHGTFFSDPDPAVFA